MNKKLSHIVMALFIGVLTCSMEGQFSCQTPGDMPIGGGIVQPLVSDQYGPANPRQRLDVDDQIQGTRSAPAPGIGLMQTWSF
ncbi:MAG: hypothetical protein ABSH41_20490 [Syntrophobacteraceae bacterium]|jgi:hypothetical protein